MEDSTKSSGQAFAIQGIEGIVRGIYFGRSFGDTVPLQPGAKRIFAYTTPRDCRILTLSAEDLGDVNRLHRWDEETLGLWITSLQVGGVECVLTARPQTFLDDIFDEIPKALRAGQTLSMTVENRSEEPQVFDGRMMVQE